MCTTTQTNKCTIAGNNLFGQWNTNESIVSNFREVPLCRQTQDSDVEDTLEIVEIYWFYNIYKTRDSYFVSGIWANKEKQFTKVLIPDNVKIPEACNFLITGNDNKLFFVQINIGKLWIMDLQECNFKEISFNETPVSNRPKRKKEDSLIKKATATNGNLVCLTDSGAVYSGLLPSLVNTEHCEGSVCDIQCGFEHFVLLTDAGRVYTWGNGRRLQLGHGDLSNLESPSEVDALAGIKIIKISAGGWHSAAISEFGDLYVWGWNDTGQLGIRSKEDEQETVLNTLNSYAIPTLVDIFDENGHIVNCNVKDVACGSRHSALILEDNSVWSSGNNKYGQLGFDPGSNKTVNYFKKSYQCKANVKLLCGPWTTVIVNE